MINLSINEIVRSKIMKNEKLNDVLSKKNSKAALETLSL